MADKCSKCESVITQPKEAFKCKDCSSFYHQHCCSENSKRVGTRGNWRCEGCALESSSVGSRNSENQSAVLEAIAAFRKESNSKLDQTVAKLNKLQSDVNSVVKDVSGLKVKFDDLKCTSDKTVGSVEALQVENSRLQNEVSLLRGAMADLEQHSRKNNIIISGVPVTPREDIFSILFSLARLMDIDFARGDVSAAHRLQGSRDGRPPGIIINFISRATKMMWVSARRQRKSLSAREIAPSFPDIQLYVNEHLTKDTRDIFNAARNLVKTNKLTSVWTSDCRVLAKKSQSGHPFRITSLRQVQDIESATPTTAGSEVRKMTPEQKTSPARK